MDDIVVTFRTKDAQSFEVPASVAFVSPVVRNRLAPLVRAGRCDGLCYDLDANADAVEVLVSYLRWRAEYSLAVDRKEFAGVKYECVFETLALAQSLGV